MSLLDLQFLYASEERLFHDYERFLQADSLDNCCLTTQSHTDFYICTRIKNHKGKHAAVDVTGGLICAWENNSIPTKVEAPEFFT